MTLTDFIFVFIIRVDFFMIRVDPSPILFYFYFFVRSESIRVDPNRTGGPDFCTACLAKMFICSVSNIYHTSWWSGAVELHTSVDLLCGIMAAAELHISVDLLCGITAAKLHNSVDLLCGTTAA